MIYYFSIVNIVMMKYLILILLNGEVSSDWLTDEHFNAWQRSASQQYFEYIIAFYMMSARDFIFIKESFELRKKAVKEKNAK